MINDEKNDSQKQVMNHLPSKDDINPRAGGNLDETSQTMEELKKEMGTKKEAIEIHSMPGKFVAQATTKTSAAPSGSNKPQKKGGSSGKKIVLAVTILVVLIVAVIGGGLWYISQNRSTNQPEGNEIAMN